MNSTDLILVDTPMEGVSRLTLNRPEKRNALSNALRAELFAALQAADSDPAVRVMILRGSGSCFSAGYDLKSDLAADQPYYSSNGLGFWARHVVEGCFRIWDLAKPVIAQVHGYCLAGGSELASACDLVYIADDAQVGYPAVRSISPPDNQLFPWIVGLRRASEMMLSGDSISGTVAAEWGFANAAVPVDELEQKVLDVAARLAQVPPDIQQLNKRALHRQMEIMGIRAAVRAGTELQALGNMTASAQAWFAQIQEQGLKSALTGRDEGFKDYRTVPDQTS